MSCRTPSASIYSNWVHVHTYCVCVYTNVEYTGKRFKFVWLQHTCKSISVQIQVCHVVAANPISRFHGFPYSDHIHIINKLMLSLSFHFVRLFGVCADQTDTHHRTLCLFTPFQYFHLFIKDPFSFVLHFLNPWICFIIYNWTADCLCQVLTKKIFTDNSAENFVGLLCR